MTKIKPKCCVVNARDFDREQLNETMKNADKGNTPAMLDLIMHNQSVINWRLCTLSKKGRKKKKKV